MAYPRIPGIPGAPEPSFRTGDRRWMSLDTLVMETISTLAEQRQTLSPMVVKATIQVARRLVVEHEGLAGDALVEQVALHLRHRRVLMPISSVRAALVAYIRVVADLDVVEISETLA